MKCTLILLIMDPDEEYVLSLTKEELQQKVLQYRKLIEHCNVCNKMLDFKISYDDNKYRPLSDYTTYRRCAYSQCNFIVCEECQQPTSYLDDTLNTMIYNSPKFIWFPHQWFGIHPRPIYDEEYFCSEKCCNDDGNFAV